MTSKHRTLRLKMLATTATAAILSLPTVAHAQLVNSGDLVSAEDSAGNPGQLTITNPDASTANISVLAPVVVANWNQFNVPVNTTLNVSNASAAAQASLLNRVIGGNFSNISGTVNAAGVNFWLVNQNGILFGDTASVSASSFYASTLDVTDADFFDFYEGTDLAGNGTGTIHFQTNPAATTFIGAFSGVGTSPTFVTDGTLMFVGPALNLTGTFDAGTGKASFIAATDVDVSFNAGSPVGYTITAGTTVADQLIDGSVTGNSADFVFALQSSAGVMSGLLQIDADVATNAVSTDRGIYLFTTGDIPASVTVGGAWTSSGGIETDVDGDLTISQNASGSYANVQATGDITTQGISATSFGIDIDSTGAGDISVGALSAVTDVAIDTSGGQLTGTSVNAGGNFTVGAFADPNPVTFTGNISAGTVDIESGGALTLEDVTATAGKVDLAAMGALNAGTLTATGLVAVNTPGSVTLDAITADSDGTGGEGVAIGTVTTPASITIAGTTSGGSATIRSLGNIALGNVTSTAGLIDIDTTNGSLSAGAVSATGGDAQLTAVTTVTTTSISSTAAIDVDSTASGNLNLGNLNAGTTINLDSGGAVAFGTANAGGAFVVGGTVNASSITASGNVIAGSVDFNANGNVSAQNVSSTAGDVTIDSTSGTIGAGLVSATGGSAVLLARGSVTTSGLSATANVSARSTNGGAVSVGNISAGGSAALNTAGSVTAGSASVGGVYSIGATNTPNSVTLTGNSTAGSVFFRSSGLLSVQDVTATAGSIDVAGANVTGSDFSATNNVVVNVSNSVTLDSVTADSDGNGTGSALIGQATTPVTLTINGPTSGASAFLRATSINVGNVTATAGGATVTGGTVTAGAVRATGGDAIVSSVNNLTTSSITSTTGAVDVDSTGGGNLNLGNLAAATTISVDTSGSVAFGTANAGGAFTIGGSVDPSSITASGNVTAGRIDFDSTGALNGQNLTSTAGGIDIATASINAGAVSATGGTVRLVSPGAITTTSVAAVTANIDIDSTSGGNLNLGNLAASTGIALDTSGSIAFGSANSGGPFNIGSTTAPSSITATGNVEVASVIFRSAGAISLQNVATVNSVLLTALNGPVSTGTLAVGGAIRVLAAGATGSITTGIIEGGNDISLSAATDISTGNIRNVGLASFGSLGLNAGGSINVGTVTMREDVVAKAGTTFSATGITAGDDVVITAAGLIDTGNVTATGLGPDSASVILGTPGTSFLSLAAETADLMGSNIVIESTGDAITTGSLSAANDIRLTAAGAIATAGLSQAGGDMTVATPGAVSLAGTELGGALVVGTAMNPVASATFTDDVRAGSVSIQSGGAVVAQDGMGVAQNIEATAGAIDIDAASVSAGVLRATGMLTVDAAGPISLAGAVSDSDGMGFEPLAIGATTVPSTLTITGATSGGSVDLQAVSDVQLGSVTSTAGNVAIDSTTGSIGAGLVSASRGNALLTAPGSITTTGISATLAIDVGSTAGGALSLGNLDAGGAIALDTSGTLQAGSIDAGGALTIGNSTQPTSVLLTGDASGASVDIRATNGLTAQDITATTGEAYLLGETIVAGNVTAAQNLLFATQTNAGTATFDSLTSANGLVAVDGTVPGSITVNGATSGAQVSLVAINVLDLGDVTSTNGFVRLSTAFSAPGTGSITAGNVSATGGNASIVSSGSVSTTAVSSTAAIDIDSIGGGDVSVGDLNAGTQINLDTTGALTAGSIVAGTSLLVGTSATPSSVTFTGDAIANSMTIMSLGAITTQDLESNQALLVETANAALTTGDVTVNDAGATLTLRAGGAAGTISTGGLATNGGNILVSSSNDIVAGGTISTGLGATPTAGTVGLHAGGAITTAGIAAGEDIVANAGLTINVGDIVAGDDIALVAVGSIEVDSATTTGLGPDAASATFAGAPGSSALVFNAENPDLIGSTIRLTSNSGDLRGGSFDAAGNLLLKAETGNIAITGSSAAGGDMTVDAIGDVALGGTDVAGTLAIGQNGLVPSTVTLTGPSLAGTIAIDTTGLLAAGLVEATAGDLDVNAGSVSANAFKATGNVTVDAAGAVSLVDAIANSDGMGVGDLVIGATTVPSALTISGSASGTTVDLQSTGNVILGTVASGAGNVDIDSTGGDITATFVTASGGDALLTASGNVTTGGISATNAIDVDSTAGGALSVGNLDAGTTIDLDTTGALSAGTVVAGGAFTVGATAVPASATFTGDIDAASVDFVVTGAISGQDVLARAGAVDIQGGGDVALADVTSIGGATAVRSTGGSVSTGAVSATGGDALLTAAQNVTATGPVSSTGNVDIDATNGAIATAAVTAGGTASLTAGTTVTSTGTVQGKVVDIDGAGNVTLANVVSTGGLVDIDSTAGSISTTGVSATGGDALLTAAQNVTATGPVSSTGNVDIDATNGAIATAAVTAGGTASLTAGTTVTSTGTVQGKVVDIDGAGNVTLANVVSTGGLVDIDSTAGSISTTGVSATGGDALLTAAQNVAATGPVSSTGNVDIDATNGAIATAAVTAGGTASLTAKTTVTSTGTVQGKVVDIDGVGNVTLANVVSTGGLVDIDSTAGSISTTGVSATGGDALLTAAQNVTATGPVSSTGNVDIDATNGAIATAAVTAGGTASLTAETTVTSTGTVQGKVVDIDGAGNVTLANVVSTGGLVDIDSTAGSISTTGVSATGGDALLTAAQNVTATGAVTSSGKVDIDATGGAIAATAITANGGAAELTARNAITTTGLVKASGAIDVDSTGGGALTLGQALTGSGGALQAGTTIALDTTGAVTAGGTTAGGALTVGTVATPSSVTFTGPVSSNGMTVRTSGTFTSQAAVNAGNAGTASITARDVAIGAGLNAGTVTLKAASTGGVALGSGSATFSLSDTELDRITATNLTIDAGANAVTVTDVSLTNAAGSTRVDVTTTGTVSFNGDLTADGATRTIRFGGAAGTQAADANGLASGISGDIEAATINVGQATLDLRGRDIAFGRSSFLADVAGKDSQTLGVLFVGNATSSLYNSALPSPLGGDRASDPVYLKAGNLSVSYSGSALFQNTGTVGSGATTTNGVVIGSTSGGGTVRIDTLDPSNAFALFGKINNLEGPAAAVAGGAVIVIDDTLQTPFSRINGCIIASGAGCLNTTVGTTAISLPRESTSLLSGDTGLLVPFDPLVGTNNEGLFSDAASDDQNLDCPPDQRDAAGVCVDRQGGN